MISMAEPLSSARIVRVGMSFTFILGILDVHFASVPTTSCPTFSKALWLRLLADASDSNFSKGCLPIDVYSPSAAFLLPPESLNGRLNCSFQSTSLSHDFRSCFRPRTLRMPRSTHYYVPARSSSLGQAACQQAAGTMFGAQWRSPRV